LTFPKFAALADYWKQHPPVHVLLKAIAEGLSGKRIGSAESPPQKDTPVRPFTEKQFNELAELMGGVQRVKARG